MKIIIDTDDLDFNVANEITVVNNEKIKDGVTKVIAPFDLGIPFVDRARAALKQAMEQLDGLSGEMNLFCDDAMGAEEEQYSAFISSDREKTFKFE